MSNISNRRDFLKQTCAFCAAAAGIGFLASQLESCKTPEGAVTSTAFKPEVTKSQIRITDKAFETQNNFVVTDMSMEFPVLIVKHPDGTYSGLQMKCTHRTYPLKVVSTGLHCNNHGSEFDFNGNVTHGPASMPLKKYPATLDNGQVVVKLNA